MDEPARLEELTPGARLRGVVPDAPVTVVQVQWHGANALTLTYRDERGGVSETLLYRDDEARLDVTAAGGAWSFDADGKRFRLVSEARRIRLAYLFDPFLAVNSSNIEPLPHQITAVYGEMLPRQPLRFLLADDPGAGKTIMAGLYMKELMVRGDLARGLIVAPGSLVEQWQDELYFKFGLEFEIVTRDMIEASRTGNPFGEKPLLIARIDQVARNEELTAKLAGTDWDLIVVDEAHKMSAHYYGRELKETRRYRLGKLLGGITRHFLLMTATPHSGKEEDFQLFMALLDSDRFEGKFRDGVHTVDTAGLMRRLVKEKLLRFDGRPLFPERRAYSVSYTLSELEVRLYAEVTEYVREEMNRAERLAREGDGKRGAVVGFALTILQRRLASSPEAIYQSLRRRRVRLEDRVHQERTHKRAAEVLAATGDLPAGYDVADLEDTDELLESELEQLEEQLVDQASAARTVAELEHEIEALKRLEQLADDLRKSGTDRKWEELSSLLTDRPEMYEADGGRRKIIIFTEHVDTLRYLTDRIRTLLGRGEAVVTIHGGTRREERRKTQELFTQDKDVTVLVATDAAGEGINLQRAHLMVNYDLPWNPNRIEQRFGRIHRIGQTEVCHLWNLVAAETREGAVFQRLFEKLETQRESLGGQVFDVLGEAFSGQPLRELLLEAIRYGERPEVRARLDQVVDATVGETLTELIRERALASDLMTSADVERIREEMEQAEARRLQPHFIRSFFAEAFSALGGRMSEREQARFEVTHVPADIRNRDRVIGVGAPVLRRYERVTFDKELVNVAGKPRAEFLAPGHPLMEATVDVLLERDGAVLKKGAVLVDDDDHRQEPRVLLYLEHAVTDARTAGDSRRVVSKRFEFIELYPGGEARKAGHAPFLDYRPTTDDERSLLKDTVTADWLGEDFAAIGHAFAIAEAVPSHMADVRRRTVDRVDRTIAAVKARLTAEIGYWDSRAMQLKEQEQAGRQPRMNWQRASQRADELQGRLKRRLADLEAERQLSPLPPVVVGGALIVPAGLLASLGAPPDHQPPMHARNTEETDRKAVGAVMQAERALGRHPTEMPHHNPGFDVLSKDPGTGDIFFIEVKGRVEGAPTVCVKKTQILTALNKPDQFILALVEVPAAAGPVVRYLRQPFDGAQESYFDVTSVNYTWAKLFDRAAPPA